MMSPTASPRTLAAAALLRPYVDEETHWVIKYHGLFQGYYYFHHHDGDRTMHKVLRPVDFCHEYDQNCFDPNYPVMDLQDFRPMLGSLQPPVECPGRGTLEFAVAARSASRWG